MHFRSSTRVLQPTAKPQFARGALLLCVLGALGCDGETTEPAAAKDDEVEAEKPAARDTPPPPAGTLERLLHDKAEKYAAGLRPLGPAWDGHLEEGAHSDQLLVLEFQKCYRIVGVGGPEVVDLDLVLLDPDNVQVQRDFAEDPYPVLGEQAEICPGMPGAYRLRIQMFKGRGRYLVRAYVLGGE